MTTESNTGFRKIHHEDSLGSIMNWHAISFRSTAINSSSEMISSYFAPPSMILARNSSIITTCPALVQPGNSSVSSLLLDSVAGLKHDAGLAVEWSVDEQYILEDGLEQYKEEPNIMKYIKIAATLPDKTVRDVALRCRWMQRKRRKPEEHNGGKKVNNRKDKLVESSSKMNKPSALLQNMAAYPLMMNHLDQNERMAFEGISGKTMHLLKQNAQAFSKITFNLSAYKSASTAGHCRLLSNAPLVSQRLQDNIDLFFHARNNITAILNDMRDMPGLMSQMPPLPVSINEDLANSVLPGATNILPSATRSMIIGSPSRIHLKQEPRC
ncbi:uncharacterized protein LOC111288539 isoform X1 [Durio zibethinus]|uniref:Uncharacterized protein LOC111288539 isoform X1 n=1 Tax=Durio zibethinus TaxID=66656 RepID=A0A6P5Y440_DURZI|nr:uncharacterized protein LOC111288539 isoform X1 [Durio zibethinus]